MTREPLTEELLTLGIVQRGQGPFVLVPVLVDGVERYALAAHRNVAGEKKLQLLALCLNLQDQNKITSLDGAVASPLHQVGAKS